MVNPGATNLFLDMAASYGIGGQSSVNNDLLPANSAAAFVSSGASWQSGLPRHPSPFGKQSRASPGSDVDRQSRRAEQRRVRWRSILAVLAPPSPSSVRPNDNSRGGCGGVPGSPASQQSNQARQWKLSNGTPVASWAE
nr:hypothetical protein Iba_chr02cCG9160 [Ipomoea batatas]